MNTIANASNKLHNFGATHNLFSDRNVRNFWAKVDKHGPIPSHQPQLGKCWEWKAVRNFKGYGQFKANGSMRGAHKISWEMKNGPVPIGLFVMHLCDNPACVNPQHLTTGTPDENVSDMMSKKRNVNPKGEKNGTAKLTNANADSVRKIYAEGNTSQRKLALLFGVHQKVISNVILNKSHKV